MSAIKKYILLLCVSSLNIEEIRAYDIANQYENKKQDYMFSYGVQDLHTGDVKSHWEKKIGNVVHGHYTVMEPDGSLRIVYYTADEKNGFQAEVKHQEPNYQTNSGSTLEPMSTKNDHRDDNINHNVPSAQHYGHLDAFDYKETAGVDSYLFIPSHDQLSLYDLAEHGYEHKRDREETSAAVRQSQDTSFSEVGTENDKDEELLANNNPNTFITNKQPLTTPGLKNFADERKPYLHSSARFPQNKGLNAAPLQHNKRYITYNKRVSYYPYDS